MTQPIEVKTTKFILSDISYNKLKFIALILLPALMTLYFTVGEIWHIPDTEEVIGTLSAIDTFLGVVLGISTRSYNASEANFAGQINVEQKAEGGLVYSLELNGDPADLVNHKSVTFKIGAPSS